MIDLNKIVPFTFQRVSTQIRYFEDTKNEKKGIVTSVFGKNIDTELKYLDDNSYLTIRHLTRAFLEKSTVLSLYQQKINQINTYKKHNAEYLETYGGNLSKMNLATFDPKLIKGLNFIYEINHMMEMFINNPKDDRIGTIRRNDLISLLDTYLIKKFNECGFKDIKKKVLIIPVNEWLTMEEMKSANTYKDANKNPFVMLMQYLKTEDGERAFRKFSSWTIILMNVNEFMVLDLDLYYGDSKKKPKKSLYAIMYDFLMNKCKSSPTSISVEKEDTVQEEEHKEISAYTQASTALDEKLKQADIDPSTIDSDKKIEMINTISDDIKATGEINKEKLDSLTPKDLENIENFNMVYGSNQSIASVKRDQMLKEQLGSIKIRNRTFAQLQQEKEFTEVTNYDIKAHIINDNLKNLTAQNFEKDYLDKMWDYDLMRILTFFAEKDPSMTLIKLETEDKSDNLNRVYRHKVVFEDANRKRHSFAFLLPKMYQDRYIFLNENKKDITHQLISLPIVKNDKDISQITTNYNKVFVNRVGVSLSPKINKLIKFFKVCAIPSIKVFKGDASAANREYLTSVEYDEISENYSRIIIGSTQLNFTVSSAEFLTKTSANETEVPLGNDNKMKLSYFISGMSGEVRDNNNKKYGQLSDFLVTLIGSVNKFAAEQFNDTPPGTKFMYSRVNILAKEIPTIILGASMCKNGLQEMLERAKIKYELSDKRISINNDEQGIIRFDDCYLIFDRYPFENSLLMNGLSEIETREFTFSQMNDKGTYVDIYDMMFNKKNLTEAIENYNQLMVDPKTLDITRMINQPDNFVNMLIYASGLLADNKFLPNNDYRNFRIRSTEIVMTFLYHELAKAYGRYRINNDVKFSIPEDAVIKALLQDQLVDEHSALNMYLETENARQLKTKGPFGLNVDEAYTIDKRAYNKTMMGIAAMATPPTGEVGVRRNLSLNYKVSNLYGFIDHMDKEELDGTAIMSPAELCNVYNIESADPLRSSMTVMQSKHLTPTTTMSTPIISYDMQRVMPHITDDFAFRTKKKGKVISNDHDILIIQYDDGTYDDVDLCVRMIKNSGGGFYQKTQLTPIVKPGDKFDAGEVIAFDDKHISQNDMFGDPVMFTGLIATIACATSGDVHEDSQRCSYEFSKKLTSKIGFKKDLVISSHSNIKKLVKVGDLVKVNDPLLIFNDTKDAFTSTLLDSLESGEADISDISNIPIFSKKNGIVSDIKIYYTVPLEEMTPSLQKVIKSYNAEIVNREKLLNKYHGFQNSNTIVAPSKQIAPDSRGKVKGISVNDGILIEIFVEFELPVAIGDKVANYTALKGIVSNVTPPGLGEYTIMPDGFKQMIDTDMSFIGSFKRMTKDFFKVGAQNKLAIHRKRQLRDKYLDKL